MTKRLLKTFQLLLNVAIFLFLAALFTYLLWLSFGKSYIEIFLDCPLEVVIQKDVKGLYQKAKNNEIKNVIGFHENSPYEKPTNPDITINTSKTSIESSLKMITDVVLKNQ